MILYSGERATGEERNRMRSKALWRPSSQCTCDQTPVEVPGMVDLFSLKGRRALGDE